MHKGSCLCGAVQFEVQGDLPHGDACHCTKCRKWSGHFAAGTDVPKANVKIQGEDNITWYPSSEVIERGFCKTCGSSLFFKPKTRDWIGISYGAFDTPTNSKVKEHIFIENKGDYYKITDDIPQFNTIPGQL